MQPNTANPNERNPVVIRKVDNDWRVNITKLYPQLLRKRSHCVGVGIRVQHWPSVSKEPKLLQSYTLFPPITQVLSHDFLISYTCVY